MRALPGRMFLIAVSFITLNIPLHSFLACRFYAEKLANNLMRIPLNVICCFSLIALNIFSLHLIFVSLIIMYLGVLRVGFILYGTPWAPWTWVTLTIPMLGKFSAIISSSIFSDPFSLLLGPL